MPRVLHYDADTHAQNWAELIELVNQIEQQTTLAEWPLTDDVTQCRACVFQTYCGRQDAGVETAVIDEDADIPIVDSQLEPDLP